uniref:Junctional adhesion molecule C-like n=1 Tax=Sinocyclocheilus anshuiensis TaxID=1608454 RepID=A0A671NIF2_9TELE
MKNIISNFWTVLDRFVICSLLSVAGKSTAFAVILRTTEKSVWTNEFESIELTCLIESISTNNPRIEWKKIKNGVPSYVYFQNKISGNMFFLSLIELMTVFKLNSAEAALSDRTLLSIAPVMPRCSVPEAVTVGSSTELRCIENEGFPQSQYQWFKNNEELPEDPKTSSKFYNSSYTMNTETGSLKFRSVKKEDAGEYYCQARNEAGWSKCSPQTMEVYDLDIVGIFLKVLGGVAAFIFVIVGICQIQKSGYCSCKDHRETNYKVPQHDNRMDYASPDEGHFRHKSSFVI